MQRLGWGIIGGAWCVLACAVPALAQQTPSPASTSTAGPTPAITTTASPSGSATATPTTSAATPPTPGVTPQATPATALSPTPIATAATVPTSTDDLRALLLTEADVPAGLRPLPQLSGPMSMLNMQGYMVAFAPDLAAVGAALLDSPEGTVLLVENLVQQFQGDPPSMSEMAEGIARGAQFGAAASAGSDVAVATPAELPAPAVGEESRAYEMHLGLPTDAATMALVVFRRANDFAVVAVMVIGDAPPLAEASRLAALVDARLIAAGGPR